MASHKEVQVNAIMREVVKESSSRTEIRDLCIIGSFMGMASHATTYQGARNCFGLRPAAQSLRADAPFCTGGGFRPVKVCPFPENPLLGHAVIMRSRSYCVI